MSLKDPRTMVQKMVVDSLLESAFHNAGNVSSNDPVPGLSLTTLLEKIVPGYGLIHKFLLVAFDFDVTILVSLGVVLWLGAKISRSMWAVIRDLVYNNYVSEITTNSADGIYAHLMAFLAYQHKFDSSRRLIAETPSKSAWQLESEDIKTKESTGDVKGKIKWLNFANQEAKSQPRFLPAIGSHNFWHKGTYFQLRRKEVAMFDELSSGAATFKDKELLTLSCFGRSTEPIKKLIQDAKEHYDRTHKAKTVIKRPAHKDLRKRGGAWSWRTQAERPCRPMRTVDLDDEKKADIMVDINEYLNPVTACWYADRGIPYRRGYLFYGPPGTGKTSLTFALGGFFGLDIYGVSLLDPMLTEEELEILFTSLPARCIVLLEDIDTAGLIREQSKGEEKAAPLATFAKALQKASLPSEEEQKTISLSGLLNVIDGVASHEGHVLVMTTNHREKLDPALIRPGRIDHEVEFENATPKQTEELFKRIYTSSATAVSTTEVKGVPNPKANGTATGVPDNRGFEYRFHMIWKICYSLLLRINSLFDDLGKLLTSGFKGRRLIKRDRNLERSDEIQREQARSRSVAKRGVKEEELVVEELVAEDLSQMAKEFAKKVPRGVFSPAEIQGFLLKRKEPRKALDEVEEWLKKKGFEVKAGEEVERVVCDGFYA